MLQYVYFSSSTSYVKKLYLRPAHNLQNIAQITYFRHVLANSNNLSIRQFSQNRKIVELEVV